MMTYYVYNHKNVPLWKLVTVSIIFNIFALIYYLFKIYQQYRRRCPEFRSTKIKKSKTYLTNDGKLIKK